jgi:uncharacterized repeat protein (TIGR01451 family)
MPYQTRLFPLAVALAASPLLPAGAPAQGYVFTKIIDDQTARPDGMGDFYIGSPLSYPALDGNTVVFQDITNSNNSLWSASASAGATGLAKLADLQTPVPGGVGTFTLFNNQTERIKDGVVFFEGLDSNPVDAFHGGLYTIPAAGGAISRVVDYNTPAPDAGGPFIQSNANNQLTDGVSEGDYDYEEGVIAFHGLTTNNGDGVYAVNVDGTGLTRLADKTTLGTPEPFPVGQYYSAAVHAKTAVFYGATVFGPYGIFASPQTGGLSSPLELASPSTPLPGGQSPEQTTVYFTGFGRFDHVTGNLTFAAHDGSGINGLYTLPANALGGGVISRVVDNTTPLPGSAAPASYFDGTPFSADGGQVAFVTADDQAQSQSGALYVANEAGGITRVIGIGDVLDGITLTGIDLGAHALSGGRIAFSAGSYLQGKDGNARYGAIFVATPLAMTADVAVALTASAKKVAAGEALTYTVQLVNNGPAIAPTTQLVDTLPADFEFVSATGGASAHGGVVTLTAANLAVGARTSFEIVGRTKTPGMLVNSVSITGSIPDANLGNNSAQVNVESPAEPTVHLRALIPRVTVGSGDVGELVLTLSTAQDKPVLVHFTIKGTAINGKDYAMLADHKMITPGTTSKPIKIKPLADPKGASEKIVSIILAEGAGYKVGTHHPVKVKILDARP